MEIALALFGPEQIPAKLHDFAGKDLLQHIYLARFLIGILPGIALGAAACYFFRNHTRRGLEGVRAQVFLSGLHSGNTVSDANYAASFGFMEQLPPEVIQSAAALSKAEYGGRTFPIIAEAYRRGMKPKLPIWQKIIILGSARTPQKEAPPQVKPGATPYRHALNLYKYPT